MRIGVDARALAVRPAGIEVYTRNILKGLAGIRPRQRLFLYATKDFPPPAEGPFVKRLGRGPAARKGSLWIQTDLPGLCGADRLDLFWSPLQTLPVLLPRSIPAVLTVHDFVQERFPASMQRLNWLILKSLARPSWKRADAFLTGSVHSRDRLRKRVGPGREIRVVPHGPMDLPEPPAPRKARARVEARFGIREPYLLYVGTLEPRKNLRTLVDALVLLEKEGPLDRQIVLAGGEGWKSGDLPTAVERANLASRVVFTGAVTDEELANLYAGADLFVYPSLYEGFGLPVLEAMAMGVPVVSSRAPSLPEVVGEAGALFDPRNPADLASTLRLLLDDPGKRARMARAGRRRAKAFSWKRAAEETQDLFDRVAHARRRRTRIPAGARDLRQEARHFDRSARTFLAKAPPQAYVVTEPTSAETSLVRDAFAFLGNVEGLSFLDYGCGFGHNAVYAALHGAGLAVGFDVSRESLRVARKKAASSGVADRAFFVAAATERLPFKPHAFQRILGTGVLHHVDLAPSARELARVLDPHGGRAAFTEPRGGNPLARGVRCLLPYPRKGRTAEERPLTSRDIRLFLRPFRAGRARPYYLFNALARAWKGWYPAGRLDRLDRRLLDLFPPLGALAAQVLLLIDEGGDGAKEGRP